jgi:hypothetical protein
MKELESLRAEDFQYRPRISEREREMARKLRQLPEEERFQFIQEALRRDRVARIVGLKLANACLRRKAYFENILDQGLETADASDIKIWLECVIPRLGFHKVVGLLTDKLATNPKVVDKARYWLGYFLPDNDPRAAEALSELNRVMSEMGLIRGPKMIAAPSVPGKVLFEPLEDEQPS